MIGTFTEIHYASLLLFGSVLLLVEGVYYLVRDYGGGSTAAINRRMRMIAAGIDRDTILATLRRVELDRASALVVRLMPGLQRLLREAGVSVAPGRVAVLGLAIALVSGSLLWLLAHQPIEFCVLGGLGLGAGLPALVLMRRRRQRLKHFSEQLPEALDMMGRSLLAGHPIAAALGMVASEMQDPAGSEFGIVVDEMTYGADLNTALRNLTRRIPHPDLAFFVAAVQIQNQTGGNLAEILSNLSTVIRDRGTLNMKVRVLTTQGRSSAIFIAAIPFVTVGVITIISKAYFGDVYNDPLFMPAILAAAFLWSSGLFMIYKLVNFRV